MEVGGWGGRGSRNGARKDGEYNCFMFETVLKDKVELNLKSNLKDN